MKAHKVFCIGFMKTGTTTMNLALAQLGYNVSDKSWKLIFPILKGNWEGVRLHVEQYDALEDNPVPSIYKELDKLVPGSKFILTVRDSESWYRSVCNHIGTRRTLMHEWVFGRGKSLPIKDKAHAIGIYETHIREVKAYFKDRPDDLLVYDLVDKKGWEPICRFLNHPIPASPFPHANKSKPKRTNGYYSHESWFRRTRQIIRFWFESNYYDIKGLLPTRQTEPITKKTNP